MKQKICIIGDGLAGLTTAAILSKENVNIDLYTGSQKKNYTHTNNTLFFCIFFWSSYLFFLFLFEIYF